MEIYYSEPKIIRFDTNDVFLSKKIQPLGLPNIVVEPMCWGKKKPEDKILVMLRFRANIYNNILKEEVFGFVYEFTVGVIPKYNETDIKSVKEFIKTALIGFQYYFEEHAHRFIKHVRFVDSLDKEELSVRILDIIYKE